MFHVKHREGWTVRLWARVVVAASIMTGVLGSGGSDAFGRCEGMSGDVLAACETLISLDGLGPVPGSGSRAVRLCGDLYGSERELFRVCMADQAGLIVAVDAA